MTDLRTRPTYQQEKLCECGCGLPTSIAKKTDNSRNVVKGQPKRFIKQHVLRVLGADPRYGTEHHNWKGGKTIGSHGYIRIKMPNHPRAHMEGNYVYEHILVAEKALGRSLPPQAQVHHVNEQHGDNRNANLVICEDHAYHKLLHRRKRAFDATGDANSLKCYFCQKWDAPENLLRISTRPAVGFHSACSVAYQRKRRENGKLRNL